MNVQGAHCNMFARVFVCGFTFLRYKLNVFLPPLPEVGCPKSLDIWNPWGKVVGRTGLRCDFFYLFTFEVPFKHLFDPIFQSGMSKLFRDSESLWKSIGKKWSQM